MKWRNIVEATDDTMANAHCMLGN